MLNSKCLQIERRGAQERWENKGRKMYLAKNFFLNQYNEKLTSITKIIFVCKICTNGTGTKK